jgi:hypothetical protein
MTGEEPVHSFGESRKIYERAASEIMMINEELARRSKENQSFSDYRQGSATEEYNQVIQEATRKIEAAKQRVGPEHHERLDQLLASYRFKYARWTNAKNANGARHVSVMIAGPSNYDMGKHEKYLSREGRLWEEYDHLKTMIDDGIGRILNGARIISSDNPDAVKLLEEKISKLEHNQEVMKAANKIIKSKHDFETKVKQLIGLGFTEDRAKVLFTPDCYGGIGFPSFELTNNNANIRRLKQRLESLKRKTSQTTTELEINGVRMVDNVEENRLQLFFTGKPNESIRAQLKSAGFRWAPSIGCWQRYRSSATTEEAKRIISGLN